MKARPKWRDWLVVALGLLLAIRTGGTVWRLSKAGERVKGAKMELLEAKKANEELRVKLEEVNSSEFVEREAREKLGMGREGEVILLLPQEGQESGRVEEQEKPNWRKWWDLYIRI